MIGLSAAKWPAALGAPGGGGGTMIGLLTAAKWAVVDGSAVAGLAMATHDATTITATTRLMRNINLLEAMTLTPLAGGPCTERVTQKM